MSKNMIDIEVTLQSPIEKVWEYWTKPEHIINWNFASDEWHCPAAINDLVPNGKLSWRMEAKDGSMRFDFEGTYKEIKPLEFIQFYMSDGRLVEITFEIDGDQVLLKESFEPEGTNADDMQRAGWQMILENFKKYLESS